MKKIPDSILKGSATITFVDQGQDFLEWDIVDKKVVACRPAQASIWVGVEVLSFPEVGKQIQIRRKGCIDSWIKYPLIKVRVLKKSKAVPA